jgi:hypothetical protein
MKTLRAANGNRLFVFDSPAEAEDMMYPRLYRPHHGAGEDLPTLAAAEARARAPWPAGMDVVENFARRLRDVELPQLKERRRRLRFGEDHGDEVDLDRLRAGQPYWRLSVREDYSGPTEVTVVADLTAPRAVGADDVLWRGAAAVALTKILEEKGYAVELWAVEGAAHHYPECMKDTTVAVRLKRPGDVLDVSTLTNVVSGWYYRTLFFALLRGIGEDQGLSPDWFNLSRTPDAADLDAISHDRNRVYVSGVFSFDSTVRVITKALEGVSETFLEEGSEELYVPDPDGPEETEVTGGAEESEPEPEPEKPKPEKVLTPKQLEAARRRQQKDYERWRKAMDRYNESRKKI